MCIRDSSYPARYYSSLRAADVENYTHAVPSDVPGPSGPARDSGAADRGAGRRRPGRPPQGRTGPHPGPGHGVRAGPGDPDRLPGPGTDQPAPRRRGTQPSRRGVLPRLRRLAAVESSRGSFDGAVEAIERGTGQQVGKRQVEQLARRSATAADAKTRPKLTTRLSKGEKRNRKRMAEVGTVFDATAAPRTSADILPVDDTERAQIHPGPVTSNKWLTASVVADAASVVAQIFAEADRRDPDHDRTWVALVDGNNHQIDRITAEAHARTLQVTIVIDFIHVLEYIWKAAWCFHREGDPTAEEWVRHHARAVLDGKATRVAGAIRRAATIAGLHDAQRAGADACAVYLTNKAHYLDYPTALASGWPIATGVIEGACRHLVKDRMDLTGARWGLP